MNVESDRGQLLWVIARAEALRRADAINAAAAHLALLTIAFLVVVTLVGAAPSIGLRLPTLSGAPLLGARLALLGMAGWVFASSWRRSTATRTFELQVLRSELHEIQQRMSHS